MTKLSFVVDRLRPGHQLPEGSDVVECSGAAGGAARSFHSPRMIHGFIVGLLSMEICSAFGRDENSMLPTSRGDAHDE